MILLIMLGIIIMFGAIASIGSSSEALLYILFIIIGTIFEVRRLGNKQVKESKEPVEVTGDDIVAIAMTKHFLE